MDIPEECGAVVTVTVGADLDREGGVFGGTARDEGRGYGVIDFIQAEGDLDQTIISLNVHEKSYIKSPAPDSEPVDGQRYPTRMAHLTLAATIKYDSLVMY
jgi:hypothetical protein